MHGTRLFPIGLVVLSAAVVTGTMVNAQNKVAIPAQAAPARPAPAVAAGPAAAAAVAPTPDVESTPAPAPELPKRPAELPPKPPKVTCHGDQITISADNSTLDAILAMVKGCTGARIDMPEGAGRIRSFEDLGPGPVREVLDQLLSGTPYNYVIQSSAANPLKVEQVMLSMRVDDTGKPATISNDIPMTAGRRAWQKMQKFDKPDPATLNADGTQVESDVASPADEATAVSAAQPADSNAAPANSSEPPPVETAAVPTAPAITPVAPPIVDPNSTADPSKAIQDRIAQMQQMFNQRQQMIQKQNQSQGAAPNN
jgi:hypothetical protein